MLKINDRFPSFNAKGVISTDFTNAFVDINQDTYDNRWKVYFFWPNDFTFVCPTEIAEFGRLYPEFLKRDTQVLGVSTDSEYVHLAWKQQRDDLRELPYPMLSDVKRELTHALGILDEAAGVAQRATFIVDPMNIIRFVMVTDLSVGRNPQEVLRVLDALKTSSLCPCGWQSGEPTLEPQEL